MHINFTSFLLKGLFLIVFYFSSASLFSQNEKTNGITLQTAEIIIRKEFTLKKIKDAILKNKVFLSQKDEKDFSLFYRNGITSGEVMQIKVGNQITGPNQPCDNSNFEQCNFTNWDLFTVDIPGNVQYSYSNVTPIAPGTQHVITTGGNDPFVPVNMVYQDGGNCSVRLGDGANVGAKGASMKQTFLVDSANAVLTFSYAVILEDGGHQPKEQPYFRVKVYDADSNSIPCSEYNVNAGPVSSGGDPSFLNQGGYSYKNWTSVFAPMNAYIGQNVTVEFIVGDCAQGGHAGWAYVEASCKPMEIITSSPVICGGQIVTLTAPPGAATYAWSGPGGAANTQSINTSIPGTYSVTVTPVSGSVCSTVLSTTLTTNPSLPIASFAVSSDSVCEGDPVSFFNQSTVSQGIITQYNWNFGTSGLSDTSHLQNPTYTYNWAGTYIAELSITTDAGCVKDTMVTITVLDGFNATFTADTFCIDEPPAILSAFSYGGTWSGTGITNSVNGTFNPDSAGIGTFPVTHFGGNGSCSDTFTANIIVDTVVLISTITVAEANCAGANDGAITITAPGATQFTVNNGSGPIVQSEGNFSGLAPGTYSITVTSANNYCSADTTFVINEPAAYAITFSTSNSNCGHPDGSAEVSSISGQIPPYTYSWSNGDSDSIASGIVNGNYSLTITDSNGCDSVITLLVNVNLPPMAVATGTMSSCYGFCDGKANVLPSGGNPSGLYTFLWSDNQSNDTVSGLCAGTYSVTVYDSELCEGYASVVVQQPNQVIVVPFADTIICNSSSAMVGASAKGGNGAPYTYIWDNIIINLPDTAVQITPVSPGCFTVFASDVNGCFSGNQTQCISIFPPLTLFVSGNSTICETNSTEISAFASGGNPDSTIIYTWSNGSNNPFQTVTPSGNSSDPATYFVSVSDGCSPIANDSVIINFYPQVSITVSQTPDSAGQPICNGTASVLVPGNPASYIYVWSNGQNTTTATGLCPGNYSVSVTDSFNCIHVDSVFVSSTVGVNYFEQRGKRPFSVYPNPSNGKFRINLTEGTGMNITIHNILGEVIYRKEIQKPGAEIDLSSNPVGIYFLQADSEGTIHSIKLFLNQIR